MMASRETSSEHRENMAACAGWSAGTATIRSW
nr:MAG TPA: hypothetical protein [Caudoviricetes sp.]